MKAELTLALALAVALVLGCLIVLASRDPVARRLAFRQGARQRTEALLVTVGSMLGTAAVVGSLVVGDTLSLSSHEAAERTLGPVDERIVTSQADAAAVARRLAPLRSDRNVDGMVDGSFAEAAAVRKMDVDSAVEPRVLAWEFDFGAATGFGGPGNSGLSGPTPRPGDVILNAPLAGSLRAGPSDRVTLYLYGRPLELRVARVLPERGLAGVGFGASTNANAFVAPGTVAAAAAAVGAPTRAVTFVSNRGGVQSGDQLTARVTQRIHKLLGPLAGKVAVASPKHTLLTSTGPVNRALTSMFLLVGTFSAVAGVMLLGNVFVMLGEERKRFLGIMRAVGMTRRQMILSLSIEGTLYGVIAAALGTALGIGVGRATVLLADRIFSGWSVGGSGVRVFFAMTPESLIIGAAIGLLLAISTVLVISARISRLSAVAAMRDLPSRVRRNPNGVLVAGSTLVAVALAALAVPALAGSDPLLSYLLPAAALFLLTPISRRLLGRRTANSAVPAAVLGWTLVVGVIRPQIYAQPTTVSYLVAGSLLMLAGVILVTENQHVLLAPVSRIAARWSAGGLAARFAVGYPLAQRFRSGATVLTIALMVYTLVLVSQVNSIVGAGTSQAVAHATAAFTLRVDYSPDVPVQDPSQTLRSGKFRDRVTAVVPVLTAGGRVSNVVDPGADDTPISVSAIGVPKDAEMLTAFSSRLAQFADDRAVWQALQTDASYVVVDANFGAVSGLPQGQYRPGSPLSVVEPVSGRTEKKVVAGVLESGVPFYSATGGLSAGFPLVMGDAALRALYPSSMRARSALLRTAPGVSAEGVAAELQAAFVSSQLIATAIAPEMQRQLVAQTSFLQLMQGYLALGLLVGVLGLGVVMVRAVRERRRTIGMLRAMGVQASTIRRSFLAESAFLAVEGIAVGAVLAVVTAWLLYQNSPAFDGLRTSFAVAWTSIAVVVTVVLVSALAATLSSASRAARTQPARALRAVH